MNDITNPPVKKNNYYTCRIDAQGYEGEGVCKINGYTLFVPGGVEGDFVKIKVVKTNKSYGYAKLVEVFTKSPNRTEPPCPYYISCGGCNLMHIDYNHQLKLKQKQVIDALERIGGFKGVKVSDTIGMEYPFEFRNKIQFPIGEQNGQTVWGLYRRRSHNIIPIKNCLVGGRQCNPILQAVTKYMRQFNVGAYNEASHSGVIRHVFIRSSDATEEIMVVIVTNSINIPSPDILVELIKDSSPGVVSIIQNINTIKTNVILGNHNIVLWGRDTITDILDGLSFEISPNSFYQINSRQTTTLYKEALKAAGLTGSEVVFDLYCGAGTISLFLARQAKKVIGIEIVESAVEDARKNARKNQIENAFFYAGAVEEVVEELYKEKVYADVVVLDPPRKGSDNVTLSTILKMSPKRIVYVSCNPATLARDLKHLSEGGYVVKSVVPVDMFPQTTHVETVVLMSRVDE